MWVVDNVEVQLLSLHVCHKTCDILRWIANCFTGVKHLLTDIILSEMKCTCKAIVSPIDLIFL